jgi:hypothetical protein
MLDSWVVEDSARRLVGSGSRYDAWRRATAAHEISIPVDSVALVETNSRDATVTLGLLGIGAFTTLGAVVSVACLSDPKSCFGSCPTFYVEGDDSTRVQAEGFSASVAKVLEARDVDALAQPAAHGRELAIHMRNEAWETHLIRRVSLLTVLKPSGGHVFAAGDSLFYPATDLRQPVACLSAEGDCSSMLAALDGVERSSTTDSSDLARRETLELTFADTPERAGLVLTARNSLVTTFVFYQTMSYLGSHMGEMAATIERGTREAAESRLGMARVLGSIEVQLRDPAGSWRTVGTYGEAGPIASDTKVVPLPLSDSRGGGPLHVRLRMARGSWRIDRISLAALGAPVVPARVRPSAAWRNGALDSATAATLSSSSGHVVSLPGDDYRVTFALPQPAETLEIFLESEGYYYEWMRREWLAEENLPMAALVLSNPSQGLRRLAPAYKAGEARMDSLFWDSRFNRREANAK